MKKLILRISAMVLFAFLATSTLAQTTTMKERKVLFIGIDGVRSDALQAANTPHLDSLFNTGISTYESWHLGITSSGPSWSSMLTGVWESKHGVTNNGYNGANFSNYPYFSNLAKQIDPSIKAVQIVTWNQMDDASKGAGGFVTNANWDISIDPGTHGQGLVTAAAKIQLLDPDIDIFFIHYDECDAAGHGTGFSTTSPTYMNAIQQVDSEIGEVLDALKKRPNYANEDWLILGTTDHGGQGFGHGGNSDNERKIWWYASSDILTPTVLTGPDPGSYQMSSNPVDPNILENTAVLTDITVTALDWVLPFHDPETNTAWNLDGKSWLPDSIGMVDTTTSISLIENNYKSSFKIYPNPSEGELVIDNQLFGAQGVKIELFSSAGTKVNEWYMRSVNKVVDVSNQPSGVYVLRLSSSVGIITKRIIIK